MQKRLRTLLALVVASIGLLIAAPAASAVAYPPTTCPTLSVSTTTPLAGATITVTGSNFTPGANITLELHTTTYVLAHVTASASGAFSASVTMPAGVTGAHDIVATGGASVPGCPASPVQAIDLQAGAQATGVAGGGGGGGTAFTGVDVLLLLAVAGGLVAIGVAFNSGGKRRRRLYPNELG
jgi:hypothetical protein